MYRIVTGFEIFNFGQQRIAFWGHFELGMNWVQGGARCVDGSTEHQNLGLIPTTGYAVTYGLCRSFLKLALKHGFAKSKLLSRTKNFLDPESWHNIGVVAPSLSTTSYYESSRSLHTVPVQAFWSAAISCRLASAAVQRH